MESLLRNYSAILQTKIHNFSRFSHILPPLVNGEQLCLTCYRNALNGSLQEKSNTDLKRKGLFKETEGYLYSPQPKGYYL